VDVKPGYQRTEVGVIPDEWEVAELRNLGTPVRGSSPRPAGDPRYFDGSHIPWLTVAALTNLPSSRLLVTDTESRLTAEGALYSRRLAAGTLILANSGATLGVAKILGIDCCANDGIAALLQLSRRVSPAFLAHFINSRTGYLREVVATGNGQPNLNTSLIGSLAVPVPKRGEQDQIVTVLNDADALIESLERLLAKKRQLKQAVMHQLLTGKTRLPGFTGEWRTRALGRPENFLKGAGIAKADASSGPIPCIRYGELYTDHLHYVTSYRSRISAAVAEGATRLVPGDLLFAASGETKAEIGKCAAFVDDVEAYAGGDILILRGLEGDPILLGHYLNFGSIRRQMTSLGQGDAVVHIAARALASIEAPFPSPEEQEAIGEVLLAIDADIGAAEQRLLKAEAVRDGCAGELLSGRSRLLGNSPSERFR
jgi:type I restriction enzyme S subunit